MKTYITCAHCKRRNKITNTTLIQTHWYQQPYGCNGGDSWHEGERRFVCHHCAVTNRLLFNDEVYDETQRKSVSPSETEFFREHIRLFYKVLRTYEERTDRWVNNFTLSKPKPR